MIFTTVLLRCGCFLLTVALFLAQAVSKAKMRMIKSFHWPKQVGSRLIALPVVWYNCMVDMKSARALTNVVF